MRTTRSGESALLLLDVIDLLADQNIEYAVVGALAASVHGAVRASMDADVVLSVGVPQAEGIGRKLKTAGFHTELVRGDFDDPIAMKVFAGGPMDLLDATRAVTAAGSSLDLELVRRLAKRFGRAASESLEQLLKS